MHPTGLRDVPATEGESALIIETRIYFDSICRRDGVAVEVLHVALGLKPLGRAETTTAP